MIKHTELSKIKKITTFSGTISSTSGVVTDSDVQAGDLVLGQIQASTTSAALYKATAADGQITFLFSAAPGASTTLLYIVLKGGN